MSLSTEMRSQVRALLDLHGQNITFRATAGASYAAGGTVSGGSNSDETARVAFIAYRKGLIDASIDVERGDRVAIISSITGANAGLSKVPKAGDQLVGEDDTVKIVYVDKIQSAGNNLVYVCLVRE